MCQLVEHIPLEQGLRPYNYIDIDWQEALVEHIPLEQGLRLYCSLALTKEIAHLVEHIPLEQGLRRTACAFLMQHPDS